MSKNSNFVLYHVAYEPQSGVWTMIKNLIAQQKNDGYRSSCIIYYSTDDYLKWISREVNINNIDIHCIKIKKSRFSRLLILFNSGLSNYINANHKNENLKIFLNFHDAHFSAACLPLKLKNKSENLIVFHGCPNGLLQTNYVKLLVHWFLNVILLFFSSSTLITVSEKDIELIRKKLVLPKKRFKTIYNGVPEVILLNKKNKNKNFVIGFIGTIDTRKQWWIAMDAIEEASKQSNNIILKIAGNGPDKKLLEERVLLKPDLFNYVGEVSNPTEEFYNDVDVLLMTSKLEGLPMVILEAFSLGIPVISTPVGGIPEIVINGYNGYLVNDDSKNTGNKISLLNENKELLQNLSNNACSTFKDGFTIQKCSERYVDTFLNKD